MSHPQGAIPALATTAVCLAPGKDSPQTQAEPKHHDQVYCPTSRGQAVPVEARCGAVSNLPPLAGVSRTLRSTMAGAKATPAFQRIAGIRRPPATSSLAEPLAGGTQRRAGLVGGGVNRLLEMSAGQGESPKEVPTGNARRFFPLPPGAIVGGDRKASASFRSSATISGCCLATFIVSPTSDSRS